MIELKEIKKRRKNLDLTQSGLAKLSEVSQSALAKIESGRMNPSFEIAKRIFNVLEELESKISIKAKDIMTKKIITVDSNKKIPDAADIMKRHNISQLPVVKKDCIIGVVSETTLLEKIGEKDLSRMSVAELMADIPPVISENTPVRLVSELLRFNPILIVKKQEKISGVITKADLLKVVK